MLGRVCHPNIYYRTEKGASSEAPFCWYRKATFVYNGKQRTPTVTVKAKVNGTTIYGAWSKVKTTTKVK